MLDVKLFAESCLCLLEIPLFDPTLGSIAELGPQPTRNHVLDARSDRDTVGKGELRMREER